MIFNNRVTDITYQEILPSLVDQINNSNVFTARVLQSFVSPWKGIAELQPVQIANSTTGGSFSGMDVFPTSATNNTRSMTWYVKAYEQSIVIPGIERSVNADTEKQAISLVSAKMDEARISAAVNIGTQFYGTGLGNDFEGLGLIVDDGTATASYAGITRATNPWVNGYLIAAPAGVLSLDLLGQTHDAVRAATSQSESPTIGLTTKSIFTLFESLLTPTITSMYTPVNVSGYNVITGKTPNGRSLAGNTDLKGLAGFCAITYRGLQVAADDMCPDGLFFFLNENYISFDRLKLVELRDITSSVEVTEGYYKDVPFPSTFQFRDFIMPVQQYGWLGFLLLAGQLKHRQPRRNGVIKAISTV
jgi:hypothetical protein